MAYNLNIFTANHKKWIIIHGLSLISLLSLKHAALHCFDCASEVLRSPAGAWSILPEMFCQQQVDICPRLEPDVRRSVQPAPAGLRLSATIHTATGQHWMNRHEAPFITAEPSVTWLGSKKPLFFFLVFFFSSLSCSHMNGGSVRSGTHDVGLISGGAQQPRRRRPTRASAPPNMRASFIEQLAPSTGHVPLASPAGGYSCMRAPERVCQCTFCVHAIVLIGPKSGRKKKEWG